jgi:hypothetical protein
MPGEIIQSISTYTALLPILIGSFVLRRYRLLIPFWCFLVYGFLTDQLSMIYALTGESKVIYDLAVINQNIFSLVDSVFLSLFIGLLYPDISKRKVFYSISIVMFVGWFWFYVITRDSWFTQQTMSSWFDSGYEMLLSILAAISLLRMTRTHSLSPRSHLWIMIGVFFYNFIAFFAHAFTETIIADDIWFLTCTINIITMAFYGLGFCFALSELKEAGKSSQRIS